METTDKVIEVFTKMPDALPLYEALEKKLLAAFPDAQRKVDKTQITFKTRHGFAIFWPPVRRVRGRPDVYVVLSVPLDKKLESERIVETAQPRHNRWVHHILMTTPEDLDDEVMGWLQRAFVFSMR